MGRIREFRNGPRIIDLDLIIYEGEERNTEEHQANVVKIRTLLETAFAKSLQYTNEPSFVGGAKGSNLIGSTGFQTDYMSQTYEVFHILQFNQTGNNGTITLNNINYNACEEVYFGMSDDGNGRCFCSGRYAEEGGKEADYTEDCCF